MGSVIDYIECPHCKTETMSDFYYKTGEEYINCGNCGYHYSSTYKRDKNGQFVTKDGTYDYSFENLIMATNELKNPYGAYRIKTYDSVGYECGSLKNKKHLTDLKKQLEDIGRVELFTISRFVDGQIVVETIIDNGPKYDGAGFSVEDRMAEL